ncbi:MAG: ferredoxin--NADP reductase [Verrucomicrobia bacterium]|nr:MAG: ferredoxin--NADP reductase [Verrucomicrobiota bacterium]
MKTDLAASGQLFAGEAGAGLASGDRTATLASKTTPTFRMNDVDTSKYNATVVGREEINPELIILRVKPDGELFEFKPGQFAVLGLLGSAPRVPEADPEDPPPPPDKLIRRAYSISSSSLDRDHVEFYLTLVKSGELTPRLFALRVKDRLWLSPKASGLFTLDKARPDRNLLLVATGTGLAPYMSMLRTMLVQEAGRKFVVLHGARHSWDLGYRAELQTLARLRPNLIYLPAITRPHEDPHWTGLTGRIQTLLANGEVEKASGLPLDPEHFEVFLCGNPAMVDAAKELLGQKGFVPDQGKQLGTIHVEEYW